MFVRIKTHVATREDARVIVHKQRWHRNVTDLAIGLGVLRGESTMMKVVLKHLVTHIAG